MENVMDTTNPTATIKCWVELYSDSMYSWALHKTNSVETAEDLVQDTFLAAFQSIHKFEGKSKPKTWLFAILNNKIAEYYRKVYKQATITESQMLKDKSKSFFENIFDADEHWKKEQQPKEWHTDETNLLDDADFINMLQSCMGNLPENWIAALQLKYLDEKKGELICQEMQISPTNFWQILHRAKLQLRKCLEIHWFKK